MNYLQKAVSGLTLSAALAACGAPQSGPKSAESNVDDTRAALSQLGVTKQGLSVHGPFVESTACVKALSQDTGEELAGSDAKQALDDACGASAPGSFVPKMQGGRSNSGNVHCVKVKTPVTDTCTGQ